MTTAILQLNPPWYVMTPKGEADVRAIIDYGPDDNPIAVCHIHATGEWLNVVSSDIKFIGNAMYGIEHPKH